jgi:hypothetical protein
VRGPLRESEPVEIQAGSLSAGLRLAETPPHRAELGFS